MSRPVEPCPKCRQPVCHALVETGVGFERRAFDAEPGRDGRYSIDEHGIAHYIAPEERTFTAGLPPAYYTRHAMTCTATRKAPRR